MNNNYFTKSGKYDVKASERIREERKAGVINSSPRKPEKTWATIQQEYKSFKQSNLSLNDYLIQSR